MAGINLSNLTDRISQVLSDNVSLSSVFGKNDRALMDLINSLSNGETILGKVLSSNEDSFQISTQNNVIINAKAENGILLTEGSNVLFEVNKFSEGKVTLRPLYLNVSSEETANSALRQAGIPINERTLEMTVRNMEYGNPIDKNGLLNSYKDVLLHEDFPVKYIVDLQKMDIPVTHNNLVQYEAYMNMKNIVSESFMDVSTGIMDEINQFAGEGLSNPSLSLTDLMNNESIINLKGMVDSIIDYSKAEAFDITQNENTSLVSLHELDVVKLQNELKAYGFNTEHVDKLLDQGKTEISLEYTVDYNPKTVLNSVFKDINLTINQHISDIFNQKANVDVPKYGLMFDSSEVKDLIYKAFSSDWSLKEEDISKETISNLYKKLYENTKHLSENLSNHLKPESNALSMVNNINNNIDFMDQLNKYIPYVQIPFNDNQNNKAELYVYKNKKNFAESGGELSAYLHLDMEHLGRTDVMIKLLNNNVTTNFKVKDDDVLNFIEQNLHYLDKRLNEKGYSFKASFEKGDRENSPIQEMLNANENHLILARSSFDARI